MISPTDLTANRFFGTGKALIQFYIQAYILPNIFYGPQKKKKNKTHSFETT